MTGRRTNAQRAGGGLVARERLEAEAAHVVGNPTEAAYAARGGLIPSRRRPLCI